MNNSIELYNKAVRFYNEGYIDKALEYCEKSISSNLKNTAAINLKGLLYYFKGDLDSAEALWKMNFQVNRDLVSKKYLEDIRNDRDKLLIYKEALATINELRLKEAVNLLKKCKESDFNCINVKNSLTICYIKQGDYNAAVKFIEEVLKIDRKNDIAIKNKKELISLGIVKKKLKFKYIAIPIACIIIGLALGFVVKNINKAIAAKNNISEQAKISAGKNNTNEPAKAPTVSSTNAANDTIAANENTKTVNENIFKSEEFKSAVTNQDYEKLYSMANEWKDKELNINDKTLLQKGIELLQSSGIEYFYGKGRQALTSKDYKTSEKYFTMACDYGKEYYLYQDILYMLGFSFKNDNQIDKCIKYYEEYDSKFSNGTYEQTVLYDMSLIYKSVDVKLAKNYASRLTKQYPKSIYNNSVINNILAK
ncbi:tetratricopeptide repeat protein [Candidatus Clostridium stratigraminis]|uniref:Tetratricopeptide repeat protein n=1 Tax=Candidatus Clostridium stratigraminis TaxID=3381661 RepID=A0ABW8T931_9CLOT